MKKKGLSPVIATMLLVAIVIVIGLIVFLWFRGVTEEAITKFDGQNVKLVCEDVEFDASVSNGQVSIINTGNVPIYKMKTKLYGDGNFSTQTIEGGWPEYGLNQGGSFYGSLPGSSEKVIFIPVLIGHSSKGDIAYTCDERHGYEIIV